MAEATASDRLLKCTLDDIMGIAEDGMISYKQCAEILEEQMQRRFLTGHIDFGYLRATSSGDEDYCSQLAYHWRILEKERARGSEPIVRPKTFRYYGRNLPNNL